MEYPIIGVTTYNQENKSGFPISAVMHKYISAIGDAGGAVVLLPSGMTERALVSTMGKLNGVLFTGGGDVDPSFYHSKDHHNLKLVDTNRDITEITLAKSVALFGIPFLGICRGLQVLNVAFGGTLFSHIPSQFPNAIKHDYNSGTERELLVHDIKLETDSQLMQIMDEEKFRVNSLHHQGIKDLAQDFRAVGFSPDGLIEAIELPTHQFGMAVQWHPEWLTKYPSAKRLFTAFVEAAKG